MKVFTCVDHDGFYPVGVASVIVAESKDRARSLLDAALVVRGLKIDKNCTFQELNIEVPNAYVLRDGDY